MNEWYVVTAGHCVARARASQVRVTLGEYVLKSSAEPLPGRTYGVSRIKVHPYFKFTPQADRWVTLSLLLQTVRLLSGYDHKYIRVLPGDY